MRRAHWRKMERVTITLVALALAACSGSRQIASPTLPGPELNATATSEEVGLTLKYILVPNGPGSWVKDAQWHEYVFTLRNLSDKTVTIDRLRLIDPRGLYIDPSVSPLQLEKTSDALAAQYKDAAVSAIPAALGAAALIGAGAAIGVVAAPAVLVVAPAYGVYKIHKAHRTSQEREELERELTRRQLPSFTLAGQSTVSGSIFFPIVPNPRAFVVNYRLGSEMKEFALAMSAPAGLPTATSPPVQTP